LLDAEDAGSAAQRAGAPQADNPYLDRERRAAWSLGYRRSEHQNHYNAGKEEGDAATNV
jgi:hypothetical protein